MTIRNKSLYFHSIGDIPLSVSVKLFGKQINFIEKSGYEGKPIKDFETNRLKRNCVFVTFDDCFASVYENAVSVLKKHNFKATFYAAINYIGKRRWGSVKYQRWSDEKTEDFNVPFDYMSWDQLKDLADSGMEIGAHTITHRNLTEISKEEQEKEIFGSKEILENKLGIEVTSFCYPRGKFNDDIISIVKQAGYKYACTTIPGVITEDTNLYKIKRYPCGSFDLYFKSLFNMHHRAIFNVKKLFKAAFIKN